MRKNNFWQKKQSSAFTFIELAIVISVIAILISVIIYGANSLIAMGNISRARAITATSAVRDIDGLIAWYETSSKDSFLPAQAIDSAQITEWRDISPYALASKDTSTPANRLTKTASSDLIYVRDGINGIPSLRFGVTSGEIGIANFTQGKSIISSVCVVFSTASSSRKIIVDTSSSERSIALETSPIRIGLWAGGTGGYTPVAKTVNSGTPNIICAYFNSSSSKIFFNNITGDSLSYDIGSNSLEGITIGGYVSSTATHSGFDGMISEVIVFNRILNLNERKAVMSYLSKKYKIYVAGV